MHLLCTGSWEWAKKRVFPPCQESGWNLLEGVCLPRRCLETAQGEQSCHFPELSYLRAFKTKWGSNRRGWEAVLLIISNLLLLLALLKFKVFYSEISIYWWYCLSLSLPQVSNGATIHWSAQVKPLEALILFVPLPLTSNSSFTPVNSTTKIYADSAALFKQLSLDCSHSLLNRSPAFPLDIHNPSCMEQPEGWGK